MNSDGKIFRIQLLGNIIISYYMYLLKRVKITYVESGSAKDLIEIKGYSIQALKIIARNKNILLFQSKHYMNMYESIT